MYTSLEHYIDGNWVKPSGKSQDVINPANSKAIGELGLTVEQTLGEYGVQLSGLGLTRDGLAEQLSRYATEIGNNPEPFLSRMEASGFDHSSEHELSDIQDDTQTRDSDDYEPSR